MAWATKPAIKWGLGGEEATPTKHPGVFALQRACGKMGFKDKSKSVIIACQSMTAAEAEQAYRLRNPSPLQDAFDPETLTPVFIASELVVWQTVVAHQANKRGEGWVQKVGWTDVRKPAPVRLAHLKELSRKVLREYGTAYQDNAQSCQLLVQDMFKYLADVNVFPDFRRRRQFHNTITGVYSKNPNAKGRMHKKKRILPQRPGEFVVPSSDGEQVVGGPDPATPLVGPGAPVTQTPPQAGDDVQPTTTTGRDEEGMYDTQLKALQEAEPGSRRG